MQNKEQDFFDALQSDEQTALTMLSMFTIKERLVITTNELFKEASKNNCAKVLLALPGVYKDVFGGESYKRNILRDLDGSIQCASVNGSVDALQAIPRLYREASIDEDSYKKNLQENLAKYKHGALYRACTGEDDTEIVDTIVDIYKEAFGDAHKTTLKQVFAIEDYAMLKLASKEKNSGIVKLLLTTYLTDADIPLRDLISKCVNKKEIFGTEDNSIIEIPIREKAKAEYLKPIESHTDTSPLDDLVRYFKDTLWDVKNKLEKDAKPIDSKLVKVKEHPKEGFSQELCNQLDESQRLLKGDKRLLEETVSSFKKAEISLKNLEGNFNKAIISDAKIDEFCDHNDKWISKIVKAHDSIEKTLVKRLGIVIKATDSFSSEFDSVKINEVSEKKSWRQCMREAEQEVDREPGTS
jgi:hypothetical protein